jgi:multimeric flavodoxin WrbA
MSKIEVRKGMPPRQLDRATFEARFLSRFVDPAFAPLQNELAAIAAAAWDGYTHGRKAPRTRGAGAGFADPAYQISIDWLDAHDAVIAAQARHDDPAGRSRVLLINGSSRTEHTCPGEMSKSWRLVEIARQIFDGRGFGVDVLDMSRTVSEFGRTIHPCKACASTAMPLCHWPCSCYPNYSLGQVHDWMNEIYPLWVEAHGIMIVAPVNWYHVPAGLKAMLDRLVCADGGNPDPSSTHGKNAREAKQLELDGWPFPRHLAGRLFSAVVHADTIGAETARRSLVDWASDLHMIPAGAPAELDAYVGYYEPYATSHEALDRDGDFQAEVRGAATTLCEAIEAQRAGRLVTAGQELKEPRPK